MQWRLVNCCVTIKYVNRLYIFFRWRYSTLWALACRTIPLHFSLSITNSLHLLTTSTWRSLSTSSHHPFLGLPLRLVPSSSWVKIFLGILSSSILSRWPSQLVLCPFIHFTIFSPLLSSSSSRFVLLFHSPSSYLGPLLNIFLSKISRACSSFFVIVHVSAPYVPTGLISVESLGQEFVKIVVAVNRGVYLCIKSETWSGIYVSQEISPLTSRDSLQALCKWRRAKINPYPANVEKMVSS